MNLYQPTITGSLSVSGSVNISGSITIAGGGTISGTASIATTALTASSADNLLVRNTLTAQTLVVQTITSSVDFVTGSTRFGSSLSTSTHQFTGSVSITGSLAVVTTGTEFQVNSTGTNFGNALTDSHVISGSLRVNPSGLFVSSSGVVGIGTVSPTSSLDVRVAVESPATGKVALAVGTSNGANDIFRWYDGTTQLGVFKNSGNVGIGTSSPAFKLQVGNQNISASLVVGSYAGLNPEYVIMGSENNGYGSSFFYRDMSTRAFPLVKIWINNASDTQYPLDVQTAASPATIGLKTDSLYNSIIRDYITTTTSTLDITTERTDGGGFNFLLLVSSTLVASGGNRNYYTFAVQGRGTTATATQLSNVSAGTSSRTAIAVSFPSNGVIRLTLTGGESCQIKVTAIGHGSL